MPNVPSTNSRAHAPVLSWVVSLRKCYAIDVVLFVPAASGSTRFITFRAVPDYPFRNSTPQVVDPLECLKPAD